MLGGASLPRSIFSMNTSFPSMTFGSSEDVVTAINDNPLAVGGAVVLGAALWYMLASDKSDIKKVRGWPVVGHWEFFTK